MISRASLKSPCLILFFHVIFQNIDGIWSNITKLRHVCNVVGRSWSVCFEILQPIVADIFVSLCPNLHEWYHITGGTDHVIREAFKVSRHYQDVTYWFDFCVDTSHVFMFITKTFTTLLLIFSSFARFIQIPLSLCIKSNKKNTFHFFKWHLWLFR